MTVGCIQEPGWSGMHAHAEAAAAAAAAGAGGASKVLRKSSARCSSERARERLHPFSDAISSTTCGHRKRSRHQNWAKGHAVPWHARLLPAASCQLPATTSYRRATHPGQRLLAGQPVEEGEAGAAGDEILRCLAVLIVHCRE